MNASVESKLHTAIILLIAIIAVATLTAACSDEDVRELTCAEANVERLRAATRK